VNRKWIIAIVTVVAILLLVVVPLVGSYNNLVESEGIVDQSFADLDVQLQRRNDLIPNLVSSVRAALKQEQAVFVEIARARARYGTANTIQDKAEANAEVQSALSRLLVIIESNPTLRSNDNIQDLMTQLEGTENRVGQARREYNAAATGYNIYVRRFPRSVIANMFGFERKPLFQATEEARGDAPDVDLDDAFTPAPSG
jgi:LemA protein